MRPVIQLILLLLISFGFCFDGHAQSYAFGVKGGATIGFQNWQGFQRDPLYKYHGILFIETEDEDSPFSLFAQLGYHIKGTANRFNNATFSLNGRDFRPATQNFEFNTISLTAGGRNEIGFWGNFIPYYLLGIRGDYTLSTNLSEYAELSSFYASFPVDGFVRRWGYGVTLGGGVQLPFGDLVGGLLELTVNPNFSKQYYQPPIFDVIDPFRPGNTINLRERNIYNISIELTLGIRFINKVIYID